MIVGGRWALLILNRTVLILVVARLGVSTPSGKSRYYWLFASWWFARKRGYHPWDVRCRRCGGFGVLFGRLEFYQR